MMKRATDLPPCPFCGDPPFVGPEINYKNGEVVPDSIIICCEDDDHSMDTGGWCSEAEARRRWLKLTQR